MKKVTLLLNTFPSISETFILNQVVGLKKAHWDVNVISLRKPDLKKVHPDFREFNCADSLNVIGIPDSKLGRAFYGFFLVLKLLICCPGKIFLAFHRRYTTASTSLKNLYLLNRLRKEKIPLLQAHFGPNGLVGTFLKDAGIVEKLIVTFHGSDINSYPKRYGIGVYKELYKKADRITANTEFTAGKIVDNGASRDQLTIIPVGLNCADYPPREDPQGKDFRIVTVGRLVEKKGHRWMMEAMGLLVPAIPQIHWHIVGSGSLEEELRQQAKALNLKDHVHFHGSLSADQVRHRLEKAHVFVLPSVTASSGDMEGQGLVLQEAQAMGLPVLSTLHNGIPDGVLDGESGFLVPEKDPQALAENILKWKDPKLRERMGRAGAKFVRENYDTAILTRRWAELYYSLF